jgi:hypothetical protein
LYHRPTVIFNFFRFEKAIAAENKQRVILEVLSYHATAPVEEASKLKVKKKLKINWQEEWFIGYGIGNSHQCCGRFSAKATSETKH